MSNAPIALFVYKRPAHTRKLLESLVANSPAGQSDLWVFCEGPRDEKDRPDIEATRAIIRSQQWCGKMHVIERQKNMGCAASIIAGIDAIFEKHDRIIVLEDDLILSPHFLEFMNEALVRYADEPKVMQVAGYMFPVDAMTESDAFFMPFTNSWGWATWSESWQQGFDRDLAHLSWLDRWWWRRFRFNLYGAYYYRKMLDQQKTREIDTWDIRWYLGVFRHHGLTLYPRNSLVSNEGLAGGTHVGDTRLYSQVNSSFVVRSWPMALKLSYAAFYGIRELILNRNRSL